MKEIIKFELLYKLLCAVILLPLFNTIFNLYAKYVIGQSNIYNYEMFKVLLGSVSGLIALLFIIIVTLLLIYLEYSVIIKLIFELKRKSSISWKEVFLSSFSELSIFRKPKNTLSFLLFALLNPLWHLTFTSSLITELNIPLFITNEILKNSGGIILVGIIYLILFIIYGLLSFVPIYMVLKKEDFIAASISSIRQMRHNYKMWLVLVLLLMVSFISDRFIFTEFKLKVTDFNFYFLRYFFFSNYFKKCAFLFVLKSVVWSFIGIFAVSYQLTYFYSEKLDIDYTQKYSLKKVDIKNKFNKHKIIYSFLILTGGIFFIVSYFNQFPLLHLPYSIGHRGDINAVENSIDGIVLADKNHTDYAEIDIQLTKDNELVVFHDKNLKRLAKADKDIRNLTLEEIKSITIQDKNGHKSTIPTLEEAIISAKESQNGIGLLIEFKPSNNKDAKETVIKTIDLIEKYDFFQIRRCLCL